MRKRRREAVGRTKKNIKIREIRRDELDSATELVVRLKKLNAEFDPLLKTTAKLESEARASLARSIKDKDSVVLVAVDSRGKVVGLAKGEIKDRHFYEPRSEGIIVEFYILPEFRRGQLGRKMLEAITLHLERRGAGLIAAEFPDQNEIAKNFYTKLGFRALTSIYAKPKS